MNDRTLLPEIELLELLALAPTPLYSSYRWPADRHPSLAEPGAFAGLVDRLLDDGVLRLAQTSMSSDDFIEHAAVPDDLFARYAEFEHDDRTYDPFEYVLLLGPAAPPVGEPGWAFDLDSQAKRFQLVWQDGDPDALLACLHRVLPKLELVVESVLPMGDGAKRAVGRVEPRS